MDGEFSLNVPNPKTDVLIISYLGMKEQRIPVNGRTRIEVEMEDDSTTLEDIVVIGYGAVKKRDLTGAVTSVKAETITMTPTSNPMEALQGRVAGLDITKSSGQAGSGVAMQLRGNRSFNASGSPMFIIDGMPGDYATLNPNDIQSIEVLKDASSTAIYGSAGANGVILITTKQGEAGKVNVNLNAYVGINSWSTVPEMLSGEAYMEMRRQAHLNAGTYVDDATIFNANPNYYTAYQNKKFINWADALLQDGLTQNYSLSVSGGTEKTKAYMSLNFSDETGQYRNDTYKVYSTNLRVDHKVKNWLSVGVNMQGSYVDRNSPSARLDDVITKIPYGDLYDADGNYTVYPIEGETTYLNPLINNRENYRNKGENTRVYVNPYIRIAPVKGLTIESRVNASLAFTRSSQFAGIGSFDYERQGANKNWQDHTNASVTQNRAYNYKWENILTYNFTVANDHDFTLTAVSSWNHNQSDVLTATAQGISDNKTLWHNMSQAVKQTNSTTYTMSKGMGIIGRLNYSYKGKYLFSASFRSDGSSVLAAGHKWATFPAVSAGWRISEEKFMENTRDWLDNLKVRLSYGETGSSSISPYTSVASLEEAAFTLGTQLIKPGYRFTQTVANPYLTWERSKSTNVGLDLTMFGGRVDLTMDYYNTDTDGVIWTKPLPVHNGGYSATTPYNTNVNIAQTNNQGFEFALNTRNVETKNFTWTSAVTFAYNKEKINKLLGTEQDNIANGDYALAIGHPVNSYYHFKLAGIWQTAEADEAAIFKMKPGDIKIDVPGLKRHVENGSVYYTEVDAEGVEHRWDIDNQREVTADDYQIIGHNSPDWTLGFQNTLTYKNFDLSIYMYMRWGQMMKYDLLTSYSPNGGNNTWPAYFDIWSPTNPSNDFPALNANINDKLAECTGFAALAYVDGSFFKIKNITLGYTLPKKVCTKIGIQNLRIYGTITNPLVVAKSHLIKQYDPEMNGAYRYPLTKQLVFGVNFSF